MNLEHFLHQYGYLALILGSIFEGETILLIASFFIHQGYLSFIPSIFSAALGGIIGDQCFFFLGHFYGQRLLHRWPKLAPLVAKVTKQIYRHNTLIILGVRFMYGFRIAGPIAIGMSKTPIYRFVVLNVIGALLWATLILIAGYLFGSTLAWLLSYLDQYGKYAVLAFIVLSSTIFLIYRYYKKR